MDKIAILPVFGALLLLAKGRDARDIFVSYFLPVLTLIPAYYQTKLVSGIPEFAFWTSALIPIVMVWVMKERMEGYEFSWIDLAIVLHLMLIFYAQFDATGYKDAQKILFREVLMRMVPFFMLKAIMMDAGRRKQALIVMTILGAIVSIFMIYEFRLYTNLIDKYIRQIWPYGVPWGGSMNRFGFKRAAGSFAHPISAGYFFSMMAPIAFWLWRNKHYTSERFGLIIFGLNALGVITSISRAPMAGLALSAIIIWFGWSRKKVLSGGFLIIVAIIGLSIYIPKFVEYTSIERSHAKTQDQENAAYRKEMLDNYIEIIKEKPVWGWGRYTFPVVKGQKSIDNEYLFIAITGGMINLSIYLLITVVVLIRLGLFALRHPGESPEGRLAWVLIAAWLSALFTQATVYSGMQTTNYFFMIAAISEALVLSRGTFIEANSNEIEEENEQEVHLGYNFSRTL